MPVYSVVDLTICSRLDGTVVESRYWQEIFLFSQEFRPALFSRNQLLYILQDYDPS
jgi:hypothetical protein